MLGKDSPTRDGEGVCTFKGDGREKKKNDPHSWEELKHCQNYNKIMSYLLKTLLDTFIVLFIWQIIPNPPNHFAKWLCKWRPCFVGGETKAEKKKIFSWQQREPESDCRTFISPFALLLQILDGPIVVISELWFCFILLSPCFKWPDFIFLNKWREAQQHILFVCIGRLRGTLQIWGICGCNPSLPMRLPPEKCSVLSA